MADHLSRLILFPHDIYVYIATPNEEHFVQQFLTITIGVSSDFIMGEAKISTSYNQKVSLHVS